MLSEGGEYGFRATGGGDIDDGRRNEGSKVVCLVSTGVDCARSVLTLLLLLFLSLLVLVTLVTVVAVIETSDAVDSGFVFSAVDKEAGSGKRIKRANKRGK